MKVAYKKRRPVNGQFAVQGCTTTFNVRTSQAERQIGRSLAVHMGDKNCRRLSDIDDLFLKHYSSALFLTTCPSASQF